MRLLLIALCFVPTFATASGKISIEPRYNDTTQRTMYVVGLGIYERLLGRSVYYNGWTGFGDSVEEYEDYQMWAVSKHHMDFVFNGWTVSPGVRFIYRPDQVEFDKGIQQEIALKLTYNLW